MSQHHFLQGKIHRATITEANVEYEGSISIDPELLALSNIRPFERVDVYNIDNGERLTTYAINGRAGEICLNGAAARKGEAGQRVIIAAYCLLDAQEVDKHIPAIVLVGENNKPKKQLAR